MLAACNNNEQTAANNAAGNNADAQKAVIENIMTRVSVRQYTEQPVEQEKIDILLKAAMAAPTAVNKQPWHFIVVTDKEKINQLAGPHPTNAPLMIAVCGDMSKAIDKEPVREIWVQDASAATENLLLAAHALGLGAVWTGAYPDLERSGNIGKVLGTPENIVPLCVVRVGYPAETPEVKDKYKEENVSYNTYGAKK